MFSFGSKNKSNYIYILRNMKVTHVVLLGRSKLKFMIDSQKRGLFSLNLHSTYCNAATDYYILLLIITTPMTNRCTTIANNYDAIIARKHKLSETTSRR